MARVVIGLFGLILVASAAAAEVRDPTRPPPGYEAAEAGVTPPPPAKVTSVMLRPGGRSVAMVDGVPVKVGDSLAEGRVTGIDEGGLWIRTDSGPKRIGLLSAVVKTPTAEGKPPTGKKAPAGNKPAAKMEKTRQ